MRDYREEYLRWCTDPVFDEGTRRELSTLGEEEIRDRFYRDLTFGTGGLRGVLGAGTNRMNIYTVGKATQGLADFIRTETSAGSVVIAYDSRHMSAEFALDSALILAANGIKAFLFEGLRPTPELSFAVRHLHATAGIVITASHNPPQYNGYKVYWSDGGQIVAPYDRLIEEQIGKVGDYAAVKRICREEAERAGLLVPIGEEVDEKYREAVESLSLEPKARERFARELKIVYTPLNGTGNLPVRHILRDMGFENVYVVPEQEAPDGDFPTLPFPNPEVPEAFTLALRLARDKGADLVLATDPDADRLGVCVKDPETGEYHSLTGNMCGLLLAEYILSRRAEKGLLPEGGRGAIVTTVVSSKMAYDLAAAYGLTVIEVLTGFKYVGEQIALFEERGDRVYEFGYEESYGCLPGTHARDKDGVAATAMLCEAAAFYRSEGLSLWEQMTRIYEKYGYYRESQACIAAKGVGGAARIAAVMEKLRAWDPASIGGQRVLAVRDYLTGKRTSKEGETPLGLPASNVFYFELEENGWCCARPSGTEPKIKFYFGTKGRTAEESLEKIERVRAELLAFAGDGV